jgi:hypothetical protein
MNIKWALGTVVLIVSGMFALPGIVSADPGEITGSSATYCDDGGFSLELDFNAGSDGGDAYVEIEGDSYAETAPPAGMTATGEDDPDFYSSLSPNEWDFENFESRDDFFTLSGDYDSVDALGGGVLDVDYRLEWNGDNNDVFQTGGLSISSGPDGDDNPDNDWEKCIITYCEAGDVDGGNDYSFQASPTNDCDPVRICLDGESMTVTEYTAGQAGGEKGSCVPSENPPPPPPATEEGPAEPVSEVEEAVEEASPTAEEVAALPAAGLGETNASGNAWIALLGLTLLGVGGTTVLIMRRW